MGSTRDARKAGNSEAMTATVSMSATTADSASRQRDDKSPPDELSQNLVSHGSQGESKPQLVPDPFVPSCLCGLIRIRKIRRTRFKVIHYPKPTGLDFPDRSYYSPPHPGGVAVLKRLFMLVTALALGGSFAHADILWGFTEPFTLATFVDPNAEWMPSARSFTGNLQVAGHIGFPPIVVPGVIPVGVPVVLDRLDLDSVFASGRIFNAELTLKNPDLEPGTLAYFRVGIQDYFTFWLDAPKVTFLAAFFTPTGGPPLPLDTLPGFSDCDSTFTLCTFTTAIHIYGYNPSVFATPEPGAILLVGHAALFLLRVRRRRQASRS